MEPIPLKAVPHVMIISPAVANISMPHAAQMYTINLMMAIITKVFFGTHARAPRQTCSVSSVATHATRHLNVSLTTQACQTGQLSLSGITGTWLSPRPGRSCAYGTMSEATVQTPTLPIPNTAAHCVQMPDIQLAAVPLTDFMSVLHKVTTPYNPSAWVHALTNVGLTDKYPTLINDILYGSPIGDPPPLTHTFLPQNLPSANLNPTHMTVSLRLKPVLAACLAHFPSKMHIAYSRVISGLPHWALLRNLANLVLSGSFAISPRTTSMESPPMGGWTPMISPQGGTLPLTAQIL